MTTAAVLASCAVGHVECNDTVSIDFFPAPVVTVVIVVALVVTGILLLGRRHRGR